MKTKLLFFCLTLISILGCERSNMNKVDLSELKNIPQQKWDALAKKKIFFGHQSVGFNIIAGIDDIITNMPAIHLRVIETKKPEEYEKEAIFGHSPVGQNLDPISKCNDFRKIIESGLGNRVDIAFFKFCYVDINSKSDVNAIYKYYSRTIADLKIKYPKVRFLHCTASLTITPPGLKTTIKRIIQYPIWTDADNIKRCEFNAMLLEEFGKDGDVFDLAKYESTSLNGKLNYFIKQKNKYYSLLPEYSDDGGHLNQIGRLFVGKKLLEFLVKARN